MPSRRAAVSAAAAESAQSPWSPLAVRSFRYQWGSDLLTSLSYEMETLILGWYILVETGSVVMLTVFGSLQFLGSLVAPFTGVVADRLGSRALLLSLRAVMGLLAVLVMALGLTGTLTPWLVLAVSLLTGLMRPTEQMMRLSLVAELMPAARLMGAMSLSRITIDVARIAGALTGAGLFAVIGLGLSYIVVAVFYALSVTLTLRIARNTAYEARAAATPGAAWKDTVWKELKAGMAHCWNTPSVLAIMWLAFLVNLTAFPVTAGLLPYVARNIYGTDEIGLGHIVAAYSFGALAGSLLMTMGFGKANANRLMMLCTALWYVGLAAFAFAESKQAGMVALFGVGLFQCIAMVTSLTVLLHQSGEHYRGRVMGVRMLAVYGLPIGLVGSGFLIDIVGFVATVLAYCAVGLVTTIYIGYRWRRSIWN